MIISPSSNWFQKGLYFDIITKKKFIINVLENPHNAWFDFTLDDLKHIDFDECRKSSIMKT